MDTKKSFVMYETFYKAAEMLDDKSFREFFLKLRDYSFFGIDEPSENQLVNMAMIFAKNGLDNAEERRLTAIENGKKGGCPTGTKKPSMIGNQNAKKQNQNKTKQNLKVSKQNLNVNDNVNGNGKDNENGTGIGPISSNPEKEKDGKEIGLTTSTSIDYKEKEELDNPIVSPSDSLYSGVGNTGKTSNEYYQTIKGSDNSISIVDYTYEELSKLEELMVDKYKLTNRDFDNEYWEMFNTCVGYLQELGEYNNEEARKKLNDMLNDLYKYKKNEQFAQPVIPVPSFKD